MMPSANRRRNHVIGRHCSDQDGHVGRARLEAIRKLLRTTTVMVRSGFDHNSCSHRPEWP
jgi:hypothetical protein